MEAYGFADWDGNDRHFMGWAGTGVHFDPIIATNAAHWLEKNAKPAGGAGSGSRLRRGRLRGGRSLVPHRGPGQPARRDVVPGGPARLPRAPPRRRGRHPLGARVGRLEGRRSPPRLLRALPRGGRPGSRPTSTTTSTPSPRPTGSGGGTSSTGCGGTSTPRTQGAWLRHLDYYVHLHQLADRSLGTVLAALEAVGGVGRHHHHLHLRPRRHVRLARAPIQGSVRLRRDHAGAALREGPGRHHAGLGHLGPRQPRRPGRHHLLAGRRR